MLKKVDENALALGKEKLHAFQEPESTEIQTTADSSTARIMDQIWNLTVLVITSFNCSKLTMGNAS